MATVVNNPGYTTENSSSATAAMIGAVLLVLAILALVLFSRGGFGNAINTGGGSSTGGSVPERVDVNVNTPTQ